MKELFKTTKDIFRKDKQIWILAILIYSLIMTIGIGLSLLIEWSNILLIIFVVCPFIFTFIKMSIKGIDNIPLDNKDAYLGYKDLSRSISIVIRKLIIPALIIIIFYFLCFIILFYIYIFFFSDMNFIEYIIENVQNDETINVNEIVQIMLNNEDFLKDIMICNYISLGLTFILLNILSNKKIFTFIFYMCLDNTRINYEYIINRKKELKKYKLFTYNLFISLFYVLGIIFAVLVSYLLNSLTSNSIISYLISALVFFVICSLAIPFKYIAYTHLFNKYFNNDVSNLIQEINR